MSLLSLKSYSWRTKSELLCVTPVPFGSAPYTSGLSLASPQPTSCSLAQLNFLVPHVRDFVSDLCLLQGTWAWKPLPPFSTPTPIHPLKLGSCVLLQETFPDSPICSDCPYTFVSNPRSLGINFR